MQTRRVLAGRRSASWRDTASSRLHVDVRLVGFDLKHLESPSFACQSCDERYLVRGMREGQSSRREVLVERILLGER